jgi:hypothetical protein
METIFTKNVSCVFFVSIGVLREVMRVKVKRETITYIILVENVDIFSYIVLNHTITHSPVFYFYYELSLGFPKSGKSIQRVEFWHTAKINNLLIFNNLYFWHAIGNIPFKQIN